MRTRVSLGALCLLLLLPAADARAEWRLGAGIEHFRWTEDTTPLTVKESGPLVALRTELSHPVGGGFAASVHGRLYLGEVSYDGSLLFAPSIPASGRSRYLGTTLRGQLGHGLGPVLDAAVALDLDLWRRRFGANQVEDYRIVSVRFGAEHASSPGAPWRGGAGLKCTLATHEDAHFRDLGFDQNPSLRPGRSVTPYVEFGYAFSRRWSLVGSFDGFDFGRSNQVVLSQGSSQTLSFQPASTMGLAGIRLEYQPN